MDLELQLGEIIDVLNKINRSISGMSAYSVFSENETPAGTINGTNDEFTLAHTPATGSLQLFLNGMLQTVDEDYTLDTATITFVNAPLTGSILRAFYKY